MSNDIISNSLKEYGVLTLDGALATLLELRGCNLVDELWSAKTLIDESEKIYQVHYDYFVAGAKCVSTASYQATPQGFAKRGISETESVSLIKLSVTLAQRARDDYRVKFNVETPLLVAGSVGPYGAYLSDGSEFTGNYKLPESEMIDFHRLRVQALIDAGVDVLAFETIPSFSEAQALVKLLAEFPTFTAWFSFTLADSNHISDGTQLSDVVSYLIDFQQVVAIGINCIPPELVSEAIKVMKGLTNKPLVIYPNSGDKYDPVTKTWKESSTGFRFEDKVDEWIQCGANLIGGCCRTTPNDITTINEHCQCKNKI